MNAEDEFVKRKAEMDQALAFFNDVYPPMLASFYRRCVKEGFDEQRALLLTVEMLKVSVSTALAMARMDEREEEGE
jgi:hypothetical protein